MTNELELFATPCSNRGEPQASTCSEGEGGEPTARMSSAECHDRMIKHRDTLLAFYNGRARMLSFADWGGNTPIMRVSLRKAEQTDRPLGWPPTTVDDDAADTMMIHYRLKQRMVEYRTYNHEGRLLVARSVPADQLPL